MDSAILILAMTSVPIGTVGLIDYVSQRSTGALFGMLGAGWSIAGVVLISFGVPGMIFFPGLICIMLVGSLLQLRTERKKILYVKAGLLTTVCAVLATWMVFL